MKARRFFLAWQDSLVEAMLRKHGHSVTYDLEQPYDCAIFTGGEDICPFLYGETALPGVRPNLHRDRVEIRAFKTMGLWTPKIGICRGAQLLNVLSGGTLWQNVDMHDQGTHEIECSYHGKVRVNSYHHQMMIPSDDAMILATCNQATKLESDTEVINIGPDRWDDAEVCTYWNTNSLCFQPHPEYRHANTTEYFWELAKQHLEPTKRVQPLDA